MRKAKNAASPHCPGDTQTLSVANRSATTAKFVGLKMCFASTRNANFDAMAMNAATAVSRRSFVRRSKQSESPEMSAL